MSDETRVTLPASAGMLPEWARARGVEDLLDEPLEEIAEFTPDYRSRITILTAGSSLTIREGVMGTPHRSSILVFERNNLLRAACSFLLYCASRRELETRRTTLWKSPPSHPALAPLSVRLHELLALMRRDPEVWKTLLFDKATVAVRELPPVAEYIWSSPRGGGFVGSSATCMIDLIGSHGAVPLWNCTCQATRRTFGPCVHLRAATEWLLDALHDENNSLHEQLVEVLGMPMWQGIVRALDQAVPPAGQIEATERAAWRLRKDEASDWFVEPLIQTRKPGRAWSRGRVAAASDLFNRPGRWADEDRAPIERLEVLIARRAARTDFGELLETLCGHPRVLLHQTPGLAIEVRREEVRVGLRPCPAGGLEFGIAFASRVLWGVELEACRAGQRHLVLVDEQARVCHLGVVPEALAAAVSVFTLARGESVPTEALGPALGVMARLAEHAEIEVDPALGGESVALGPEPTIRLAPLPVSGLDVRVVVRAPGHAAWPPGEGPRALLRREGERVVQVVRNLEGERRAAEALLGRLQMPATAGRGAWHFELDELDAALDLLAAIEDLGEQVQVEWAEEGAWKVGRASLGSLKVRVSRRGSLFGVDGDVEVDGEKIPLAALIDAVRRGERYVRLGPGRFARIEQELRRRLESASRLAVGDGHGKVAVGALGATRLREILGDDVALTGDRAYADLLRRVKAAGRLAPELPRGLEVELRGYQVEGFQWMARLASWQAGMVLADDMGLGKTVQTLALLLHRVTQGPALVVAPTSVCAGWRAEAQRFAPNLDVILYRGPARRDSLDRLGPGVVLVASYDTVALDIESLAKIPFATFVLDEAQVVKNALTQRARAVRRLSADLAIALTGTPIENHLGELWSIVRIVSPGLFGSWDHFRERFAVPIERRQDQAALEDLRMTLRPFLLRRTKAAVAPELPPRTEVVRWVTLSGAEREIYQAARREALEGLAAGGGNGGRFEILAAITRLRLLACHPRLVDPSTPVRSAKLETAVRMIGELVETGQRALVFSQFTSHLALVREELDRRGIAYLYLDGSTPPEARDRAVKAWQEGGRALFLLSLKAGGRGLNLMGADCVLHLDPWWNPAVEDQATDRTHRIGQDRPVTVVRLITRGTIEEAVLDLHGAKRELASSVLAGTAAVASVSAEDLVELIRGAVPALAGEDTPESEEDGDTLDDAIGSGGELENPGIPDDVGTIDDNDTIE